MRKQEQLTASSNGLASTQSMHLQPQPKVPSLSSDAEFVFGFNVSISQIVDLFERVVEELKFEMIECEQSHATAIKHGKKSFMQVIDCFSWWSQGNVTAIKMNIITREKDSKRVCRVRGLVGSRKEVGQFIDKFRNKSKELAVSKQILASEQDELEMGQQQTNPFYLQSCAAYMFHKILSNQKYGLGSILHSSINSFISQYKNPKNSAELLPIPMKKAVSISEQIVSNLYKDFNYGRHEMQQIMPYCRISVEKYVFEKIYPTIYELYQVKNKENHLNYNKKQQKIRSNLSPKIIFEEIGLASDLIFNPEDYQEAQQPGTLITSPMAQKYGKGCRQFQRISSTQSPREKVKHCQIMYTYLKTIIYEQSKGKKELFNMEDIIPVLILILLLSNIPNIKTQIDIMVDFIGFDPCDLESERRLLVNISESYNYICRDWKVE